MAKNLNRVVKLEKCSPFFGAVVQLKQRKYFRSYLTTVGHEIYFNKSHSPKKRKQEIIGIKIKKIDKQWKKTVCNLGHDHGSYQTKTEFAWFEFSKKDFKNLMQWSLKR